MKLVCEYVCLCNDCADTGQSQQCLQVKHWCTVIIKRKSEVITISGLINVNIYL